MARLNCPACKALLEFSVDPSGKTVRCKNCGNRFTAPAAAPAAAEPPPPPPPPAEPAPAPPPPPPVAETNAEPDTPSRRRSHPGAPKEEAGEKAADDEEEAPAGPGFVDALKKIVPDSVSVGLRLVADPVGALGERYEAIGPLRALLVGLASAIVFDILVLVSILIFIASVPGVPKGSGMESFLKAFVGALVPIVSLGTATIVFRVLSKGGGTLRGDIFATGVSMLPLGAAAFLASLFSNVSGTLALLVLFFAVCLTVLVLYGGLTHVSKVKSPLAAWGVPVVIILSAIVMRLLVAI